MTPQGPTRAMGDALAPAASDRPGGESAGPLGRATTAVLLVLAAAAGSTDAVSYLGLGRVFPANMTGNTVLLGVGIAGGDYPAAGRSAVALAGFVGGVLATTFGLGAVRGRALLVRGLTGELAVLVAGFGLWIATGRHPAGAPQHWLIALLGAAMGVQSAAVSSLDVGVSTTFITGTWTALSRRVGGRLRGTPHSTAAGGPAGRPGRWALVLAVYAGAALGAGSAERALGAIAAVIPPALIALALAGCLPVRRRQATG